MSKSAKLLQKNCPTLICLTIRSKAKDAISSQITRSIPTSSFHTHHNHNHNSTYPLLPSGITSNDNRHFLTWSSSGSSSSETLKEQEKKIGSSAFADCETDALADLFYEFAKTDFGGCDEQGHYLTYRGVKKLLASIGENPDEQVVRRMFAEGDLDKNGKLHWLEFLNASDQVLAGAPARIVLVVGGPGSGKGILCDRLAAECGIVHLSSGDLLRDEVEKETPLGIEVAGIMERGELVSSAVITALVRRRMRSFPGRRVLLDGFPRSLQNAEDFLALCGKPELALHLDCDDTILMERIMKRARQGADSGNQRSDDNIDTALKRLRTFHKYHKPTMDWLREQHVPIVNLDCSGTPENVWQQLLAIGRLMRPAAKLKDDLKAQIFEEEDDDNIAKAS
jgi:adenylate kinase family enzyme